MSEQTDIRLARNFKVFVEEQVSSGRFENVTSVLEEGLRLLEANLAHEERIRQALIEGEESGDAGPLDMAEIKRKARELAGLGPDA